MKNSASKYRDTVFTPELRRVLLDEYFLAKESLDELDKLETKVTGIDDYRLTQHQKYNSERLIKVRNLYLQGLPVIPFSRCPFTAEVLEYSIDYMGLDGLWWNYDEPVRFEENLLTSYFALAGAVRLSDKLISAPFLCKPGPEVPYVIPGLIEHPAIRAVLSFLEIGKHKGYPITYFADPIPFDIPRVNTWGTNQYTFLDSQGKSRWDAQPEQTEDFDFELEPWISSGKLLWINPGDETLTLKNSISKCPYLDLPGRRSIQRIQNGKIWSDEVLSKF